MELEVPSYMESKKLNGTNNFQWCDNIQAHLTTMGLGHHLKEKAPIGDRRKTKVWEMEEAQIVNLMKKTMEPDMAVMCDCADLKSGKEIWEYVESLYSRDRTKLYHLWLKFIRLKQEDDMSVMEYTTAFEGLYYELERALPINSDVEHMKKVNEMLLYFTFLGGLRPEFEPVIYEILREPEMPSFNEGCCRLRAREEYLNRRLRECTYCGRQNHTRNQCWDLYGKPF